MSCFYVILYNLPLKYFLTVSIFLVWRLRVACFEPGHRGFSESAWKDRVESLEDNNNNKLLRKCTASLDFVIMSCVIELLMKTISDVCFMITLLSQLSLPESDDCLMNDWQQGDKTNLSENGSGSSVCVECIGESRRGGRVNTSGSLRGWLIKLALISGEIEQTLQEELDDAFQQLYLSSWLE